MHAILHFKQNLFNIKKKALIFQHCFELLYFHTKLSIKWFTTSMSFTLVNTILSITYFVFCLFVSRDTLRPSQQFIGDIGTVSSLSGLNQRIKYLAQGHNTVPPVSLEEATLRPQV